MFRTMFASLILANLCVSSCVAARQSGGAELKDSPSTTAINCGRGTYQAFTFGELAFVPDAAVVHFGSSTVRHEIVEQVAGRAPYIRLDVCVDGEDTELKSVIFADFYSSEVSALTVDPSMKVYGLHEAIFLNDQSKLDIQIPTDTRSDHYLFVSGWTSEPGKTFATATFVSVDNGDVVPLAVKVLGGMVVAGDPLESLKCPLGKTYQEKKFQLGTAAFVWDLCTGLGGGETTSYEVIRIEVTDNNPDLTESERAVHTYEGVESVAEVLNYRWNHHNACDSFVMTLPHATYAATSSTMAGCGLILPGAPTRSYDDDREFGKTMFTVAYHGAPSKAGTLECAHPLFSCDL